MRKKIFNFIIAFNNNTIGLFTCHVDDIVQLKQKMLNWANQFNIFCFLDNQEYSVQPQQYECLLAAGTRRFINSENLEDLDTFLKKNKDWVFGHLSYELKNSVHQARPAQPDPIGFPPFFFFVPQVLLEIKGNELFIAADDAKNIFNEIMQENINALPSELPGAIQQKLTREEYIQKIKDLRKHIARGDCYEINFCQEFFVENVRIAPIEIYRRLIELSPNPFSALYKLDGAFLICASPERFLLKRGRQLFSQPMKGTIRRDAKDKSRDERLKEELKQSAKDQSENVMVVDMVRNDLSKVCTDASVKVDELFGVYTYPHIHQMISTISGTLKEDVRFSEIIRAIFPMGSMTGAPKHRVMELIDQYEVSPRGIFSGSVGYINPEGDFDFNVVIRSIMYNALTKYLSYQLGSGITFYSDPEKEWDECLLKGEAIREVLGQGSK